MIFCAADIVKPFYPSTLVEWVQLSSSIISAVGIGLVAHTYFYNRKIKRAEWLKSLFEKFYEGSFYKDVRRWLDYDELANQLEEENDPQHTKNEQLADFLNFFEFIATLNSQGQIRVKEIQKMFSYYLYKIKSSPFCMDYITEYKYKNLQVLLTKMS